MLKLSISWQINLFINSKNHQDLNASVFTSNNTLISVVEIWDKDGELLKIEEEAFDGVDNETVDAVALATDGIDAGLNLVSVVTDGISGLKLVSGGVGFDDST